MNENKLAINSIREGKPVNPAFHLFESIGYHVLIPDGSRIYKITENIHQKLEELLEKDDVIEIDRWLIENDLQSLGKINDQPVSDPPLTSISLAIAQKCNLGCSYCYAQQGEFGVKPKNMPLEKAIAAVDLLFAQNMGAHKMNIAFLGGEPLANREALQAVTRYAKERSEAESKRINFSITTNGTLLTEDDADFFEKYGFSVTVSLDGVGEIHDRLRPFKGGKGSYERIIRNVEPLLALQKNMQVSARVTVTPLNLCLKETLDELIRLGFHSVGFSPMLSSPGGNNEMDSVSLETMLENMIACGQEFEKNLVAGKRYPFSNMSTALKEIHRGTHRPYPCGAGAGYLGVSASGELAACHRFVEDKKGYFGNLEEGIDRERQQAWLTERHVHRQEPCKSCWARYLCGGGCHHEVINRGRPACDYIRGWLNYVLQAYIRILDQRPDFFYPA
ncbi:MAG TPA: radical SAM protein [Puia sp.]|nr:radical SAM protein [Puia sp.]